MNTEYKISVLLPTRGRTEALTRSVKSLFNRAVNKSQIKLMLGFDNDDQIGIEGFQKDLEPWLEEQNIDYTAMVFEPLGYGRLNEYINAMAREHTADWMFFWNDDALMETTGWDRIITNHTGKFKLLAVHTHKDHPYSIFPIVPMAWLETLGYLSPHSLTDAWLSQIAYQLDIWERIEVYVTHDRADLTGNNEDDTYKNRIMYEGNPTHPRDFHHPSWVKLRMKESDQLSEYMKQQGLDTSWWFNVKQGTQDPWQKLKANDVNNQMKQFKISATTGQLV